MACAARRCSASDEASSSIESPSTSSSRVCSLSNDTSAPPSISSSVSLSEVALSAATRQRSTEQTKVTESTDSCCVEYERQDHRRLPAVAAAGGAETAHSVRAEAAGTAEVGGTGTVPGAASSRGGLSTGTTAEGTAQLGSTTPAEGGQAGLRITNTGAAVDATCGKTAGSVRNSEETQCKAEDFSKRRSGRIIEMSRTDDAESCGNVVPPTGDNSSSAGSVSRCDGKGEYIVPSVSLCCSSNSRRDRDSSIGPDGSSDRQPASGRESSNSRSANDADATAACFCMSRSCSSGSCTSSSAAGVRPRAKEDDLSEIGAHQKQQRRVQSGDPGAGTGESSSRSSVNSSGICDSSSTDNLMKLSNSTGSSSSSSIANTSSSCSTFEARLGNRDNLSVLSAGAENAISSCGLRTLTPAAESSSSINCSHRPGAADSSSVCRDSSTFVFACVNDSSCNSGASEIAGSRTDNAGGSGAPTYKRSGSSTPGLMGSGGTCGRVEEKDQRGCAATVAAGVTPQLAAATDLMAESTVIMPTPTAATTAAGITAGTTSGEGGDKSTRQRRDGKSEEAEEEEEDDDEEEEEVPRVSLTVKWNSKLYDVSFTLPDYECFSVADLKERLQQELSVPADKQKLLGFTNASGGRAADTDLLQHLKFKKENQLLLIGSSDADLLAAAAAHAAAMSLTDSVIDDFAGTTAASTTDGDELRTPLHLQRLEKAVAATHVQLLHPPREGKKLLVLDLDYTLFDCKTLAGSMDDLKRPFLNEFMESVFEDYDIAVWSQTHWKWVEMKCTELGLLTNPRFHLCFVLDRSSMFTICSRRRKKKAKRAGSAAGTEEARTHEVKALEVIWRKFPDRWNAANTIHVDDLSRNFAFNPQNGIRISAYRREKRHKDSELLLLSIYLKMLSKEKDVSAVRHKHWKDKAADLANGHSSSSSSTSSSGSGGSPPSQQRPRRGRE